jgi:PAS domain S-box-containing protein
MIDGKQTNATLQIREYDNDLIHYNNYTANLTVLRKDRHGKPLIIIISKSDTSQDHLRQEQTKESMLRYQSLFNSALVDMVYYNSEGYITDMNSKSLESTNVNIEWIRKQKIHLRDVLGIPDLDIDKLDYFYATQLYKSPDDERPLNKILKREKLYYELQIIPIRDKYGNRIGFYGSGRNVTEAANWYLKVKKNSNELQEIKDEVTTYVHNIDYVLQV